MKPADQDDRKARKRRRKRTMLGLFLFGLAIVLAGVWLVPVNDADQAYINAERRHRSLQAAFGVALSGTPDLKKLDARLGEHGLKQGAPVFMRIFKREFQLELWMLRDGKFHRFATYPICKWSGRLGPKYKTGDRQAPEGFYSVNASSLNPNSRWHRSFNLGFPNAFDRAHGRSGSFLMVHGGCSSVGCYAMTDPVIDEIWRLITAALDRGQQKFQVQVFPFRMTEANLERYADHPHAEFWRGLKQGHDLFEADLLPPVVSVCGKQYAFGSGARAKDVTGPVLSQCKTPRNDPKSASTTAQPPA
jgi:murein L,D-transpeptidase YafK